MKSGGFGEKRSGSGVKGVKRRRIAWRTVEDFNGVLDERALHEVEVEMGKLSAGELEGENAFVASELAETRGWSRRKQ